MLMIDTIIIVVVDYTFASLSALLLSLSLCLFFLVMLMGDFANFNFPEGTTVPSGIRAAPDENAVSL